MRSVILRIIISRIEDAVQVNFLIHVHHSHSAWRVLFLKSCPIAFLRRFKGLLPVTAPNKRLVFGIFDTFEIFPSLVCTSELIQVFFIQVFVFLISPCAVATIRYCSIAWALSGAHNPIKHTFSQIIIVISHSCQSHKDPWLFTCHSLQRLIISPTSFIKHN